MIDYPTGKAPLGTQRTLNGYVFEKQINGKWLILCNTKLTKLMTKLYVAEKLTIRDISNTTGIPHSTTQGLLNKLELMRKKTPTAHKQALVFLDRNKEHIKNLYIEEGRTFKSILTEINSSGKIHITGSQLRRYFDKLGLDKRTHSESIALATKHGRRHKVSKGEVLFASHSISSWNYHLDKVLTGLTYNQYKRIVQRFTYMVIARFPKLFSYGTHKRDRAHADLSDHELDHQFAVSNGYYEYKKGKYVQRKTLVPLEVMCHPCNLKLMLGRTNQIKGSKNHIEYEDLLLKIEKFKLKHGDIFDDYYTKYTKEDLVYEYSKHS